jgi:hypothetical protein
MLRLSVRAFFAFETLGFNNLERPRATKQTAPIPIPANAIAVRRKQDEGTPISAFKSTSTDPLTDHADLRQVSSELRITFLYYFFETKT